MTRPPPSSPLFPYTTLFRSDGPRAEDQVGFEFASFEQLEDSLVPLFFEDADFISEVLPHLVFFGRFDRKAAGVLVLSLDRKSTRLNSSHLGISYAVFCLKKK